MSADEAWPGFPPEPAALDFAPAAVLFDMDGLLIESERALLECWRLLARDQALDLGDAVWLSMIGVHERACMRLLVDRFGAAQAQALVDRLETHYAQHVKAGLAVKDGVRSCWPGWRSAACRAPSPRRPRATAHCRGSIKPTCCATS